MAGLLLLVLAATLARGAACAPILNLAGPGRSKRAITSNNKRRYMYYDAMVFVETIRRRPWPEMLHALEAQLLMLDRDALNYRRPGPLRPGREAEFRRFLIAAREYLLAEGQRRPEGLDCDELKLLQPLCEYLIEEGRFAPERLELFRDPAAAQAVREWTDRA